MKFWVDGCLNFDLRERFFRSKCGHSFVADAALPGKSQRKCAAVAVGFAGKIAMYFRMSLSRRHDQGRGQNVVEHMLPTFKQHDSKSAAQLVEVLHAGGKFAVADSLVKPVA